jgi:propane monooxygenase small subunit
MLVQDQQHGEKNRQILVNWAQTHGALAIEAANQLQPIWSQPRVKVAQFADAFDLAKNRLRAIAAEIGFDARPVIGG